MNTKRDKSEMGRIGWRERIVKALDIPSDILRGGMRVELRGREGMIVDGCRRILIYTPSRVVLKMSKCLLVVEGERLLCHSYLSGSVGLEGFVFCVRFEEDVC